MSISFSTKEKLADFMTQTGACSLVALEFLCQAGWDVRSAVAAYDAEHFDKWLARRVEQAHQSYLQGQQRLSLLACDQ